MNDDYDLRWQMHIMSQSRVTSRQQALKAGWSGKAIEWRLDKGSWRRLQRGQYGAFTGDTSRSARLWAAVLRAGTGAVLSHETAAEVHGFAKEPGGKIHITVPVGRNPARCNPIPGVVIHRARKIVPEWRPPWELPRTTAAATVLDLIHEAATFDDAYGWICRALGRRATTTAELRKALAGRSRIRRRALITEALGDADGGINSPLERRYVQGVERAHGLPKAERQAQQRQGSRNIYVDNLYEGYGLCVELDGAAAHPDEGRWQDTARDNTNIAADDIRTLRYGWVDVIEKRCLTAQQVADALRRQGWTGEPRPCGPGCLVGRT